MFIISAMDCAAFPSALSDETSNQFRGAIAPLLPVLNLSPLLIRDTIALYLFKLPFTVFRNPITRVFVPELTKRKIN